VTLKTGLEIRQGHWKCHHVIERIQLPIDVLVTMALSSVVSEIFNVEKCHDLEIGVRGHSMSLKVVPFGTSCMVSYIVFFSNFVPKTHHFLDIRLVSIP